LSMASSQPSHSSSQDLCGTDGLYLATEISPAVLTIPSHWLPVFWQWRLDPLSSNVEQVLLRYWIQLQHLTVVQNLCITTIGFSIATASWTCNKESNKLRYSTFLCRLIVLVIVLLEYMLVGEIVAYFHSRASQTQATIMASCLRKLCSAAPAPQVRIRAQPFTFYACVCFCAKF